MVSFPLGELRAYVVVSQEMRGVPHREFVFLLLREREQLGKIVNDQIGVVLRNRGIG